ncbi:hypothetical protein [Azospirillum sp.]|uniref:hypothetical protein n=1 Tax=Azospirillum sp. TaxID=34012 RepID=UPI002D38F086|nr:hypothetical protein [Azospirillum sp.]HYD65546.1 hypothetical protein [Azospirillum sp.]
MNVLSHHTSVPLSHLPVPEGPLAGLLVAARDRLSAQAAGRGVTLSVEADMHALLRVNEAAVAAGSWEPILPAANPLCRALTPANAFWIRGRDAAGDTVTAQAGLLYDCTARSIAERFDDMTVFYDRPAEQAPAEEWCRCTSAVARETKGWVVWTTGGWTRPDFRRRGLFAVMHRAAVLAGWLRWQPDCFTGVVDPDIVPVWDERIMGPRHLDPEPTIAYRQAGLGMLPMHFMLFRRAHMFGDLAEVVSHGMALAA